jgi:hypothetical protein
MQHLTEEQLVAYYYHDDDAPSFASEHLLTCKACWAQFETLGQILSLVKSAPVPERGEDYGEHVWKTLRWKLGSQRRMAQWPAVATVAAALAIAFFAGLFWRSRPESHPVAAVTASAPAPAALPDTSTEDEEAVKSDRVLLLVVSDHLETSERVLMQVANANPNRRLDNDDGRKRADELVSANRLYRQAALQKGDDRIAELLSDIEPVLVELSNAGATIDKDKLQSLQRRIDRKGLLFKVRVLSAQTEDGRQDTAPPAGTETL